MCCGRGVLGSRFEQYWTYKYYLIPFSISAVSFEDISTSFTPVVLYILYFVSDIIPSISPSCDIHWNVVCIQVDGDWRCFTLTQLCNSYLLHVYKQGDDGGVECEACVCAWVDVSRLWTYGAPWEMGVNIIIDITSHASASYL